ncbi:hypothetical protein LA080_016096 [Diaporthe eres]|nr:hypothetical protein LA080_016096 [Diaporthe eres]
MAEKTSSSEVFKLALSWITQCDDKCNPPCAKLDPEWYPIRLIDISGLKSQDYRKKSIEIHELPKTFKYAINFASQLHNVGWIWVDSLCIYQGRSDVARKDWLHEAALMQRVYQESHLNISATAASNSGEGLCSERDYKTLWENEKPALGKHTETTAKIDWGGIEPLTLALPEPEGLRRCVLVDTSHWDNLINKAPVNVRGWVLQERLLAPRVLHFCQGSIAWECAGFTRAEGHPTGLPRFRLQHDRILPEVSLKGLDPFKHGKDLRRIRLGDSNEPDPHIPERYRYGFELWARVVETYSRMNLTVAKDKLIALSGIAQLMSTNVIGSKEAPALNGITYGEVTDQDLLIDLAKGHEFKAVHTEYYTDNVFGLVNATRTEQCLLGVTEGMDEEEHHNVYLDAPEDDERVHRIFQSDNVYCLPAALGPRSEAKESKYIICLILQQATSDEKQIRDLEPAEQDGTSRRVGLTKLSSWGDKLTYEHIWKHHARDAELPQWPHRFDRKTKRHLIRII